MDIEGHNGETILVAKVIDSTTNNDGTTNAYHKKPSICCCCMRRKLELTRLISEINKNSEGILSRIEANPGKFHRDTINRLISKRDYEIKLYQEEMDIINECNV